MDYLLTLTNYEGPFQKLLSLVLEKKLDITEVNIAKVTDDFVAYFEKIQKAEIEAGGELDPIESADIRVLLSDFVLVVSKLVLIKSRFLLPDLELDEEDELGTKDLEERLKMYKDFRGAVRALGTSWSLLPRFYSREFLMGRASFFYPPKEISSEILRNSIQRLSEELQKFVTPEKQIRGEAINLRKKIEEVLERISEGLSDFAVFSSEKSRKEIVVLFLAVLHLMKEQMLHVNQDGHFGKILIAKKEEQSYNENNV